MKIIDMKTIDVGGLARSSAKKITSVISKKLKENEVKQGKNKINLGKLAEKLAERKEKAMAESGDSEKSEK